MITINNTYGLVLIEHFIALTDEFSKRGLTYVTDAEGAPSNNHDEHLLERF